FQMPYITVQCTNSVSGITSVIYGADEAIRESFKAWVMLSSSIQITVGLHGNEILNILEPLGWRVISMTGNFEHGQVQENSQNLAWTLHKEAVLLPKEPAASSPHEAAQSPREAVQSP
ncbi:hypothetical protein PMAYCL1PPCAC_19790, partial [Pristionchus mayeri]